MSFFFPINEENKKYFDASCSFIVGECDETLGLSCSRTTRKCAYVEFMSVNIFYFKI